MGGSKNGTKVLSMENYLIKTSQILTRDSELAGAKCLFLSGRACHLQDRHVVYGLSAKSSTALKRSSILALLIVPACTFGLRASLS